MTLLVALLECGVEFFDAGFEIYQFDIHFIVDVSTASTRLSDLLDVHSLLPSTLSLTPAPWQLR